MIIALGYRDNLKLGTQFRIWANKILKDYLTKGYALNDKKLKEQAEQLHSLKQTLLLLGNVIENNSLAPNEVSGLLNVLTDYTYALDVLDKYDHQALTIEAINQKAIFTITYDGLLKPSKD